MKGSLKVKTFACRVIIIAALLQMRKLRLTQAHTAGSREWSQKLSSCSHAPGPALRLSQLSGPRTVVLGKWEKPVPRTCERAKGWRTPLGHACRVWLVQGQPSGGDEEPGPMARLWVSPSTATRSLGGLRPASELLPVSSQDREGFRH